MTYLAELDFEFITPTGLIVVSLGVGILSGLLAGALLVLVLRRMDVRVARRRHVRPRYARRLVELDDDEDDPDDGFDDDPPTRRRRPPES